MRDLAAADGGALEVAATLFRILRRGSTWTEGFDDGATLGQVAATLFKVLRRGGTWRGRCLIEA